MSQRPALFRTVPEQDFLGFWANRAFRPDKVAKFLSLDRSDVAKVAGVSVKSVRYDQKIPKEVLDRLTEIATICGLVAQFFEGDDSKTTVWFKTPNPLLGGMAPRDMIRLGRYQKLRRFVVNALLEDGVEPAASTEIQFAVERSNEEAQTSAA
jgi:hypothetical protein